MNAEQIATVIVCLVWLWPIAVGSEALRYLLRISLLPKAFRVQIWILEQKRKATNRRIRIAA